MDTSLQDTSARQDAIDYSSSYIVQAPAGSGKTSLLVQRFLNLLARVDRPEQVLAITFTRKAAEEMRERVIEELRKGLQPEPSEEGYALETWKLAQKVLQRNKDLNWDLLTAKERLRIKTIDSFCLYLANRLPLGSHFGAPLAPSEDTDPLYQSAVLSVLSAIDSLPEDNTAHQKARAAYENMLRFCGNDKGRLLGDLCTSLQNRSLWMQASHKYLLDLSNSDKAVADSAKAILNRQLTEAIRSYFQGTLNQLFDIFEEHALTDRLMAGMEYANSNLDPQLPLAIKLEKGINNFKNSTSNCNPLAKLDFYKALRKLCLTSSTSPSIRKKIDISIGFPPKTSKRRNEQLHKDFEELLEELREDTSEPTPLELFSLTVPLDSLPNDDGSDTAYKYSDDQFTNLSSVAYLLEICYSFLREVFRSEGVCDYTEIAHNAIEALGSENAPSELALQLDSDIKHILVDEYQDTSQAQLELLERLTSHWQQEQNERTIFMVGDPMQSIYRFRQADVGIYLRTQKHGLNRDKHDAGQIKPTSKILQTNFRSAPGLIDWFNDTFRLLFPNKEDVNTSAICYPDEKRQAVAPPSKINLTASDSEPFYKYHVYTADENIVSAEAQYTADLICEQRERLFKESANAEKPPKLAVLFQKRANAKEVIRLLRQEKIPYQATDLEPLSEAEPVRDLISLTKAMLHLNDRISWLALLRSPLVGLNDNEITRLTETRLAAINPAETNQTATNPAVTNRYGTVWELLDSPDFLSGDTWQDVDPNTTEEVKLRCKRLHDIIAQALKVRGEQPLSRWVQGTWLALGGPRTLQYQQEGALVSEYFAYLEQLEPNGLPDAAELERTLDKRYAVPSACDPKLIPVQMMTMHAAKGLEFDTVILPFLNSKGSTGENGLLRNIAVYSEDDSLAPSTVFAVQIDKNKTLENDADSETDNDNADSSDQDGDEPTDNSPNSVLYRQIKKQCDQNELKRLFYVAATRARQHLHLIIFGKMGKNALSITANSIAKILTKIPDIDDAFKNPLTYSADSSTASSQPSSAEAETDSEAAATQLTPITRLTHKAWENEDLEPPLGLEKDEAKLSPDHGPGSCKYADYGVVFHTLMELIGKYALPLSALSDSAQNYTESLISEALSDQKVSLDNPDYDHWREAMRNDLQAMLNSQQGRWAIGPHESSSYEQTVCSVSADEQGQREQRLDRVFTDGDRFWIIDYKTGHLNGHKTYEYHDKMEEYAQLIDQSRKHKEIHLALIYVNHKRTEDFGGPIYLDCGLYKDGHTSWGKEFAPKLD